MYILAQLKQSHAKIKQSQSWPPMVTLFVLFCYLLVGALVFPVLEDGSVDDSEAWTITDAIYFCAVTMSTVGYGDLSPSSSGSRVFTVFMIFVGIIAVFARCATLLTVGLAFLNDKGRAMLERMFPQLEIDINGDGVPDFKAPRGPLLFYSKNLSPLILITAAFQIVSAAVFQAIEPEWTFSDALYHCVVTATTVGYGDVAIETRGGKIWACLHILFSVCGLGELLSTFDGLREERKALLARLRQLTRVLDHDLVEQLLARAKKLRPKVQRDGKGLTELEFVICMSIELGLLDWAQVRPFIEQFRSMDHTGNGRVGQADVELYMQKRQEQLQKVKGTAIQGISEEALEISQTNVRKQRGRVHPETSLSLDAEIDCLEVHAK